MIAAEDQESFKHAVAGTGVQGRNNQVTGQRGADRDVRRFLIANFADYQDLRVLTQQVAGRLHEVEAASFVDFRLHNAGNDLLGRIFYGDDVSSAGFSEMAQAGVNGGRFATPGRACKQQKAGSLPKEMHELG